MTRTHENDPAEIDRMVANSVSPAYFIFRDRLEWLRHNGGTLREIEIFESSANEAAKVMLVGGKDPDKYYNEALNILGRSA